MTAPDPFDRRSDPAIDPFPPGAGFTASGAPAYGAPAPEPRRPRRRRRPVGRWVAGVLVAALLAGVVALAPWDADRRQAYADQWVVWTEPPSASVEALAERLQLTETGRRVFFATRPEVQSARDFETHCDIEAEIVLGCYASGRIYVYAVTDDRLAGTVESTAAHELLHALYARLNPDDKARIDALVAQFVDTLPDTDANAAIVAGYPASQMADEWHSRLGTSYDGLPAELEAHYAEVFGDRGVVLAYDAGSTSAIDDYTSRIEQLSRDLDTAAADLDSRSATYETDLAQLEADIDRFNTRADDGDFSSQSEFDEERAELISRQDALESERLSLNAAVDAYNAKLAELQTLDAERAELYSHLDSHAAP